VTKGRLSVRVEYIKRGINGIIVIPSMTTYSTCKTCNTTIYLYLEMKGKQVVGEFCGRCGDKVATMRVINDPKK